MERRDALFCIQAAGYEGDQRTAMRIYVENRISFEAFQKAYKAGVRIRKRQEENEQNKHGLTV